ncbi:unnamed protein product, partial [Brugia pahangi]|uniref:IF rod domain-containing protein n=1 Tax=Brugia pahangi TaxID=6280 RepID=A0A0N4TGD2_BRUPA
NNNNNNNNNSNNINNNSNINFKVRFLEAQNRKLAADLDLLRGKWGKDTFNIKQMYEGEISDARKLINETIKQRDELEKQIRKMQDELSDYRKRYDEALRLCDVDRKKIDEMFSQLAKIEAEINALRRRITELEEEVMRIKKDNQRLLGELQRTRTVCFCFLFLFFVFKFLRFN